MQKGNYFFIVLRQTFQEKMQRKVKIAKHVKFTNFKILR